MFSIALAEQELEGYVAEGGKIEDSLVASPAQPLFMNLGWSLLVKRCRCRGGGARRVFQIPDPLSVSAPTPLYSTLHQRSDSYLDSLHMTRHSVRQGAHHQCRNWLYSFPNADFRHTKHQRLSARAPT